MEDLNFYDGLYKAPTDRYQSATKGRPFASTRRPHWSVHVPTGLVFLVALTGLIVACLAMRRAV